MSRDAFQNVVDLVHLHEPDIAEQLGTDMEDARHFAEVALYAISKKRALVQASPESLLASLLICARMKLVPGLGLGYLAVEDRNEAIFVPTYIGFIDLLERCAGLRDIRARVVYARDFFKLHYGAHERLQHRPCKDGDPGALVGVYAVATLEDGSERFEALLKGRDIDPVTPDGSDPPESARGKNQHDYAEFVKGCAVKRLAKWFTRTPEIAAAVELERAAEKSRVRPRAVDVAAMLGIHVRVEASPRVVEESAGPGALRVSQAVGNDKLAPSADSLSARMGADLPELRSPSAEPVKKLRCCACGNNDQGVFHTKVFALKEHLSEHCKISTQKGSFHDLCHDCRDSQGQAFEKAHAEERAKAEERRAKKFKAAKSKAEGGQGSSESAPEATAPAGSESFGGSGTNEPGAETSKKDATPTLVDVPVVASDWAGPPR